jgi:hypothetical protein
MGGSLCLWHQSTGVITDFITEIKLSHRNPTHALHLAPSTMEAQGYDLLEHPVSELQFWVKTDPSEERGYRDIQVGSQTGTFLLCRPLRFYVGWLWSV